MPDPGPLDEQTRRLPAFTPGVGLELANGQTWQVPRPRARFLGPGLGVEWSVGGRPDPGFNAVFCAHLMTMTDPLRGEEYETLRYSLVIFLVSRNYDLTGEELGRLLVGLLYPDVATAGLAGVVDGVLMPALEETISFGASMDAVGEN